MRPLVCPQCNEPVPWPKLRRKKAVCESAAVYAACRDLAELDHEEFWVLLLDAKNRLLRRVQVSVGGLSSTLVHPASVFKEAVREPAHAVIAVHNHPSGAPAPSDEDINLTRRLCAAGNTLGIQFLDHVIIGRGAWYSFADAGGIR